MKLPVENFSSITLGQNIPNPSNGNTSVNYSLASTEDITFEITDMTGKLVQVVREGVKTAGSYSVNFAATNACGTTNVSAPITIFAPPVTDAGPDTRA